MARENAALAAALDAFSELGAADKAAWAAIKHLPFGRGRQLAYAEQMLAWSSARETETQRDLYPRHLRMVEVFRARGDAATKRRAAA